MSPGAHRRTLCPAPARATVPPPTSRTKHPSGDAPSPRATPRSGQVGQLGLPDASAQRSAIETVRSVTLDGARPLRGARWWIGLRTTSAASISSWRGLAALYALSRANRGRRRRAGDARRGGKAGVSGRPRVGASCLSMPCGATARSTRSCPRWCLPIQASRSDAARMASAMTGSWSASAPCG
jgi:hypothetical protein